MQAFFELLRKQTRVWLLGSIFRATWHIQGFLHLLLELCQLLLSSLAALGSNLASLKDTFIYWSCSIQSLSAKIGEDISPAGEGFRI